MQIGRYRRRGFKIKLPALNWGKWSLIAILSGVVMTILVIAYFSRGLPDPNKIVRRDGFSTVVYEKGGEKVLYDFFVDENRKFTSLSDMPEYLREATIAVEDKDFYKHSGFDPLGYLRIVKNFILRGRVIGGSTLTQQLVKNVLLTNERSISRKIRELVLALRIERRFSKDEILQMYLNESPYGGTAWGVAAASNEYFGKDVKDLDLVESIILAGIPQAPSRYSPYSSTPKAYVARATEVARRMKEDGYIDEATEKQVIESLPNYEFAKSSGSLKAGHFVMYIKEQLDDILGEGVAAGGGYKVLTTLDLELQEKAEAIVAEEIEKVAKTLNISNGALLLMNPNNGDILAMVGSRNYQDKEIDGQVNVTTRLRQPGSSIKPLVYAAAFEKGYSPASVLMDVITEFPGKDDKTPYLPKNYDGKERGPVHLRESLASSLNIPAVKLLALVGVKDVLTMGYKMGLNSLEPTSANMSRLGLSLALGGGEVKLLELVSAYGAFANGGSKVTPRSILRITDRNGKTVYESKVANPPRVVDEKVAFLVNSVLSDNSARQLTFSANSLLNLGTRAVAVKTGTTNDLRDNWTIGWSKEGVVGVWVGNNNNAQMKNVASGVSGAAPIWRRMMLEFLTKYPDKPFDIPKGVSQIEVDKFSGYPAHDGYETIKDWFIDGTVPTGDDTIHTKMKVCKSDANRLANQLQISRGEYDLREVIEYKEKDPISGKDLWQKAIDGWVATKSADPRMKIPSGECEGIKGTNISIKNPSEKSRTDSDPLEINVEVVSEKSIEWVDFYLDGIKEDRFTSIPYRRAYTLDKGKHSLQVRARNNAGEEVEKTIQFSVKEDYVEPTPSPSPTESITPTPTT